MPNNRLEQWFQMPTSVCGLGRSSASAAGDGSSASFKGFIYLTGGGEC